MSNYAFGYQRKHLYRSTNLRLEKRSNIKLLIYSYTLTVVF